MMGGARTSTDALALALALAKAGELALSLLHVSANLLFPLWLKAFASVLETNCVRVALNFGRGSFWALSVFRSLVYDLLLPLGCRHGNEQWRAKLSQCTSVSSAASGATVSHAIEQSSRMSVATVT